MTKGPYHLFVLIMISATWGACSVPFANPFPNTAKTISSFSLEHPAIDAVILQDSHEITLTVPSGTDVTVLVPRILYEGVSLDPPAGVAQNFTNPVEYRVTSATGAVQTYRVTVKVLPSATKGMTGFWFSMAVGTVDESTRTVRVTVPLGTSLTDLVPTITSNGVSVSPASGVAQDFTHPVTYTVRAADGTTQAYVVTVSHQPDLPKRDALLTALTIDHGSLSPAFDPAVSDYVVVVPHSVSLISMAGIAADPTAIVVVSPGQPQSLAVGTNLATVTVTSVDGATKRYTVTVSRLGPSVGVSVTTLITIGFSGHATNLGLGSTMTVTATPSVSVDSYSWYLDKVFQSGRSDATITVGTGLSQGPHSLAVVVAKDGVLFSQAFYFVVQ